VTNLIAIVFFNDELLLMLSKQIQVAEEIRVCLSTFGSFRYLWSGLHTFQIELHQCLFGMEKLGVRMAASLPN